MKWTKDIAETDVYVTTVWHEFLANLLCNAAGFTFRTQNGNILEITYSRRKLAIHGSQNI